jgi:phage gpG-like protein
MLTGNFAELAKMRERLADLATVPSRVAKSVSADIATFVQEEFDHGADPYDDPWAPLSPSTLSQGRSEPPLTDSHAMRDSLVVRPLASAGVAITIDHPAGVHQTGWTGPRSSGPARPVLPARGELPDGWIEAIEVETGKAFKGVMRR